MRLMRDGARIMGAAPSAADRSNSVSRLRYSMNCMTKDELATWANNPRRQDTLPFGLYEPLEQSAIVGAALAVRGALYFRG